MPSQSTRQPRHVVTLLQNAVTLSGQPEVVGMKSAPMHQTPPDHTPMNSSHSPTMPGTIIFPESGHRAAAKTRPMNTAIQSPLVKATPFTELSGTRTLQVVETEARQASCPHCGSLIYSRRFPTCRDCGGDHPALHPRLEEKITAAVASSYSRTRRFNASLSAIQPMGTLVL